MSPRRSLAVALAFALGVIRIREANTPTKRIQRVADMERRALAQSKRERRRARNLNEATR